MINEKYIKEKIVEKDDLATFWGSGKAKVFSTPAMIAFMELTSDENLERFLEKGDISVGILVNIKHLKASKLGSKIRCESEIIEKDRKRIVFSVNCYDGDTLIGTGLHERYIVNKEKFEGDL